MSRARLEDVARTAATLAVPGLVVVWAAGALWGSELAAVKVALVAVVAVVLTRRWPLTGLVLALLGLFLGGGLPPTTAEDQHLALLVLACFRVGRHAPLTRQPWAAAAVLLLLSTNLTQPGRDVEAADVVFPVLLTAGPWLLGLSVMLALHREHAAVRLAGELDQEHSSAVLRATTEERLRIAQEFHDVVAHDISGLSLQAQVLRRRAEAGDPVTSQQLGELERTAQLAMTDVRRLLRVLHPASEDASRAPAPGVEDVPAMVERARRLGQQVALEVRGESRPLPPAVSSAVFRMVQEAVTNARRHGGAGTTDVLLDWRERSLRCRVTNPLGEPTADPGTGGHGLAGIRERALLFGGHAEVAEADGSWRVDVEVPTPQPVEELPR